MTTSPLPVSNPAQPPQFSDGNSCKQWLRTLPLTNVALAHSALTAQLELLNRAPIPPLERLKIGELLREPVAFVQLEMARKYDGKPLPLEPAQHNAWNSVIALWAAMGAVYQLSLQSCLEDNPDVAAHFALVTHRCLRYTGLQMLEHYRAHREIGKELWRQAHELYALAEQRDYATRALKDSLNAQTDTTSCAAAYAQILLTDLADPYRLTARQLAQLERWLDRWAARATMVAAPPDDATLSLAGVDLSAAAGPVIVKGGPTLANPRYLDTERIASTFRKRIKHIRKGEPAAALGLGEDCVQPDCEALLTTLYQHWCEAAPRQRNFTRRQGGDQAQAAFGMEAIHFFLNGEKPFKQPGEKDKLSQREIGDLQLFGRISEQTEKQQLAQLGFSLETWRIQDESALGFRLIRPGADGTRVSQKQLIAVRPSDSSAYALGVIKWLIFTPDDGLHIGVRVLPGAPLAISVRPSSMAPGAASKHVQAFLLQDMPVLREAASLVLPLGWFDPGRRLEIHTADETLNVRLQALIEKGADYERVGFVKIS